MELDKRIKALTDIITCFKEDRSRAEKCIGQNGYFADDMMSFNNLEGCIYGKLEAICIGEDYPFKCVPADIHYAFFIPESVLKPKEKEKKYRPFANTSEFFIKTSFEEGELIYMRSKQHKYEYHLMLIGWTYNELMLGGLRSLDLTELFDKFELWDGEDKFIPFGVEEEE